MASAKQRTRARRVQDRLIPLLERIGASETTRLSALLPDRITLGHIRQFIELDYIADFERITKSLRNR